MKSFYVFIQVLSVNSPPFSLVIIISNNLKDNAIKVLIKINKQLSVKVNIVILVLNITVIFI